MLYALLGLMKTTLFKRGFHLKSSSWILTPMEIRKLGGALFGDKKYNRTFIYHNGAESSYSYRGFRVLLKI